MCCGNEKIPVGTVNYFARQFPPEGWLLCDGREVSRDVFADSNRGLGSSQVEGILKHNHNLKTETGTAGGDACFADTGIWKKTFANEYAITSDGTHLVVSTFDSGDTETRPRNVALLACIKY